MSRSELVPRLGDARGAENLFRYLVIDASPIRWSLQATKVLRVIPRAEWKSPVVDLGVVLTRERDGQVGETVIVLQSTGGTFAIATGYAVHLESCDASELVAIPRLLFGDRYERTAARQLILRQDAPAIIVLDIDALYNLIRAISEETRPQLKAGES